MQISDFLSGYLPRLPFFLFLYTIIYIFTANNSMVYVVTLFTVFSVIYILDFKIKRKWVFSIVSLALTAIWIFLRMFDMALITLGAALYSNYSPTGLQAAGFRGLKYSKRASFGTALSGKQRVFLWGYDEQKSFNVGGSKKWIILISLIAVIIGFQAPDMLPVLIINLALASVADIISRQTIRSNSFFRSFYSKGITVNTIKKLVWRGFQLASIFIICVLLIGSIALVPSYIRPVIPEPPARLHQRDISTEENNRPWFDLGALQDTLGEHVDSGGRQGSFGRSIGFIIDIIGYIIVGVLGAVLIYMLATWISKKRKQSLMNLDDFEESIEVNEAAHDYPTSKGLIKKLSFQPEHSIRRMFIKKVREYIRKDKLSIPKKQDTPKQLADVINQTENIEKLNELYHKARYSNQVVTKKDISK